MALGESRGYPDKVDKAISHHVIDIKGDSLNDELWMLINELKNVAWQFVLSPLSVAPVRLVFGWGTLSRVGGEAEKFIGE